MGNNASRIVTRHLLDLIARQVEDHGLVVWYDPEDAFPVSRRWTRACPTRRVARYDGSFLQLRRDIDPLLNDLEPPRLVVYVPMDQSKTDHALVELEAAGVVMQPGQQPPARNTRLAVVARNALKPILGDDTDACEVEKQVEAGKLSLADVNALAEKGQGISKGVVCPRLRHPATRRMSRSPSSTATDLMPRSRRNRPRRNRSPCWEPVSASICPRAPPCPTLGSVWPVMS